MYLRDLKTVNDNQYLYLYKGSKFRINTPAEKIREERLRVEKLTMVSKIVVVHLQLLQQIKTIIKVKAP